MIARLALLPSCPLALLPLVFASPSLAATIHLANDRSTSEPGKFAAAVIIREAFAARHGIPCSYESTEETLQSVDCLRSRHEAESEGRAYIYTVRLVEDSYSFAQSTK